MKVKVLRRWKWKTAFLMPGQVLQLPDRHAQMLIRLGVVELEGADTEMAVATAAPRQAVKRGRGRPKGSKNKPKVVS